MSSIYFYHCDKCNFSETSSHGFPYHKDRKTGEYVMLTVPVGPEVRNSGLIDGYKSSEYCIHCEERKDIFIDNGITKDELTCPTCLKSGCFLNIGDNCPKCRDGKMEFDETLQVLF